MRVGAGLVVWTEDKGNSQTGDMGNTLETAMGMVFSLWVNEQRRGDERTPGSVRGR